LLLGTEQDMNRLEELLTQLKSTPPLTPYNLTLYFRDRGVTPVAAPFDICCSIVEDRLSREAAGLFFEKELENFFSKGGPSVCRFGGGFFGFVVPFTQGLGEFCLVGDGVRDLSVDLWQLANFSRQCAKEAFSLFPHVETLRIATSEEVDRSAREVHRRVQQFFSPLPDYPPLLPSPPVADPRLVAVAKLMERLERTGTIYETIALACELIEEQFKVQKLLLALRDNGLSGYAVSGMLGLPEELGVIPSAGITTFLTPHAIKKVVPFDTEMRQALPALQERVIACFPLRPKGEPLGFLAALDTEFHDTELLLISMVANAAGSRVSRILTEAEQSKASAISKRLMSLSNTLSQVDNKEQLYEAILGIAADLIDATQGSIMLIDSNGESMHIVFTLGMSLNVARCLPVRVGRGIAGKVAQSGEPLLVNDVEKDDRFVMINRSRFKSNSLICIPLKLRNKTIGVLNLSDKKDLSPFCQADLHLLTSFANLASLMIERTLVLEQSVKFEQLSVTDSLTGLYNRRFLKNRLEEEISRSQRHGLHLSVLFIDLDFFKRFNDVCGHLAGDFALKRTADIIKATLRDMDVVARYGGEEFCAVLPGTSKAEAMIVAERIRVEIECESFASEMDIPLRRITASVGVASFPEDGATYTELVHASDVALYQAKDGGRNRTVAARRQVAASPDGPPAAAPFAAEFIDIEECALDELCIERSVTTTDFATESAAPETTAPQSAATKATTTKATTTQAATTGTATTGTATTGTATTGTAAAGSAATGTAFAETTSTGSTVNERTVTEGPVTDVTAAQKTTATESAATQITTDKPCEPPGPVTPLPHSDVPTATSQGAPPLAIALDFDALLEATVIPAPACRGNGATILPFEPPGEQEDQMAVLSSPLASSKEVPPNAAEESQQQHTFFIKYRDFVGEKINDS
jgi:diguanylate cyclase (GGDEF)-like protein